MFRYSYMVSTFASCNTIYCLLASFSWSTVLVIHMGTSQVFICLISFSVWALSGPYFETSRKQSYHIPQKVFCHEAWVEDLLCDLSTEYPGLQ